MSTLWPSPFFTELPPRQTSQAFGTQLPSSKGTVAVPLARGAKLIVNGLTTELVRSPKAVRQPGVNDVFYNRIVIDPSALEMGNLLTNQTRSITVWNGFTDNRQLEAFLAKNADGIAISQPVTAPYTMRPLEELVYIASISTDGPASIAASFTWTVNGTDYSAQVTGRRVVIWPFGPNWNEKVAETLEWKTDVLRSFAGDEQRRSLRTKARRTFEYSFTAGNARQSSRAENLLWGWQNRTYAVPVWTDKTYLSTDHGQGDTVLNVPVDTFSFSPGSLGVLYRGEDEMEVFEVASLTDTSISLVRPLEGNWEAHSLVMPMLLGHLPTSVPTKRYTSSVMVGSLTFTCDPLVTDPYTPAGNAPVTYDGREVITTQPNWDNVLSNSFEYDFDEMDQDTGAILWDQTDEFPRIRRDYSWLLKDRTEIKGFRQMLGRLRGQWKSLYVPSWHDDFTLMRVIGAADTGIWVDNNDFRLMVGVDDARDRLMIRLNDGRRFFRKIVGVGTDGVYTSINLDTALGVDLKISDVLSIHYMMRSRLASDQITILWHTDRVAQVSSTFTTVKA